MYDAVPPIPHFDQSDHHPSRGVLARTSGLCDSNAGGRAYGGAGLQDLGLDRRAWSRVSHGHTGIPSYRHTVIPCQRMSADGTTFDAI